MITKKNVSRWESKIVTLNCIASHKRSVFVKHNPEAGEALFRTNVNPSLQMAVMKNKMNVGLALVLD